MGVIRSMQRALHRRVQVKKIASAIKVKPLYRGWQVVHGQPAQREQSGRPVVYSVGQPCKSSTSERSACIERTAGIHRGCADRAAGLSLRGWPAIAVSHLEYFASGRPGCFAQCVCLNKVNTVGTAACIVCPEKGCSTSGSPRSAYIKGCRLYCVSWVRLQYKR